MTDKKIISLLPAATEILCALGLSENLVAVSHDCDYPESIENLPVCTSSKIDTTADSKQIDYAVKGILSQGLSAYQINTDLIRELEPDTIITHSQYEACAVSLKSAGSEITGIPGKDINIISLEPQSLEDIFMDIRHLALEFQALEQADNLIEEMEERINIIRHKLKFIETRPTLACIEWLSPITVARNWMPGLVDIAGGRAIIAEEGKRSLLIDFEAIKNENPDIIVIMPCGFTIANTLKELNLLFDLPGWPELAAVKNNRIYIAEGHQYFNRPGPRIVDSIEILAEIIHPKQFIFGYEGTGWIKFNV